MCNRPGAIELDMAMYRATLNGSLLEVIIDVAHKEKSTEILINLITLAWEENSQIISDLQKVAGDEKTNA